MSGGPGYLPAVEGFQRFGTIDSLVVLEILPAFAEEGGECSGASLRHFGRMLKDQTSLVFDLRHFGRMLKDQTSLVFDLILITFFGVRYENPSVTQRSWPSHANLMVLFGFSYDSPLLYLQLLRLE